MERRFVRVQIWRLGVASLLIVHAACQHVGTWAIAERIKPDGGRGLKGGPRWTLRPWTAPTGTDGARKRIPRIIHRIDKTVTPQFNVYEQSWRRLNPGWELKIWNDITCLDFVRQEFPEYLKAYQSLSRNIERSDFFRYLVVLRMGGVYTDSDVECQKSLDDLIQPSDALIAGWEAEFPNATIARISEYARKRQVLQWTFAAAPEHPVLRDVCEHIRRHADKLFSEDAHSDVLERTGPGPWTDAVMKHAHLHPPSQMGIYPYRQDDWTPGFPEAVVLHKFQGSWKKDATVIQQKNNPGATVQPKRQGPLYRPGFVDDGRGSKVKTEPELPFERSDQQRYPISITWQPPFTMMVDLTGQEDFQAGSGVGAMLTRFGQWQPSLRHDRWPSTLEALIGGLESTGSQTRVLLDIGAGIGYYSLAAAARGHQVIAAELSPTSTASFEASIRYTGFGKAITFHNVAVGSVAEEICIGTDMPRDAETRRGYGLPKVYDMARQSGRCQRRAQRVKGARLVPHNADVGAVRVSGSGWEGWILDGLQELWTQEGRAPPAVILLELYPEAVLRNGYEGGPVAILDRLHAAGYTDILHSGPRCDARQNATMMEWSGMAHTEKDQMLMEQFTWCKLRSDQFSAVLGSSLQHKEQPENILFTYKLSRQKTSKVATQGALIGPHAAQDVF